MFFGVAAFSQSVKTLEYNVGTGIFTGLLPFDQPFNLKLTNIDKNADSVRVQLIEVPKKNYYKISKWKKDKGLPDWKIITYKDAIKWKPDGIETFQFLLDRMVKGKDFSDTFHTLAVPFYLKPESKYLIEVKCFIRRDLTEAETEALVKEIKTDKGYKNLINQLVKENIYNPDASTENWDQNSIKLQNMAHQVIKAKHPNYVVNELNYVSQLHNLSESLIAVQNISNVIKNKATQRVEEALTKKTKNIIDQVSQRHTAIQNNAAATNWPKVTETGSVYKGFINQLNSVLYIDSLLLNKSYSGYIAVARYNVIQFIKAARAIKFTNEAKEALERKIAQQLMGIQLYIETSLKKSDDELLKEAKKRHVELEGMLNNFIWVDLTTASNQYKNLIKKANEAFTKDGELMPANDSIIFTNIKNNLAIDLQTAMDAIEAFTDEVARVAAVNTFMQGTIGSTNSESLVEQAKLHVTFDLGYAYVWQIDRGNPYAGINIYFRSIDTSLPLKNYKTSFLDFIGSRTSLLVGMSVQSIQKDSVRKGIIGDNALVTGLGFRLLPWFKINGGAYMYYLYSRNPLRSKNDYSFKASPFVSLSIDFNLSSFFNTFGNGSITNIFKQ